MAQFKDTPSVEKKFKDVFKRSPGAFPEGTSLGSVNKILEKPYERTNEV